MPNFMRKTKPLLRFALLLVTAAGFWSPPRASAAEPAGFTFAQYGDIHLVNTGTSTTAFLNRLDAFLAAIQETTPVDFVVDTGDVYEKGAPRAVFGAYLKSLTRLKIPFYVLRGNHDILAGFGAAEWEQAMGRARHFSFTHQGVAFIGFDTAVNTPTWERPSASAAEVAWLAAEAARIPDRQPVVLFTHVPLASRMGLPAVYPLVNRREILDLFQGKKLLAVIGGHYHGAKESVEGGVLFTTTPTISPNRANHDQTLGGAVRLFTIRDGKITTRLVPFK